MFFFSRLKTRRAEQADNLVTPQMFSLYFDGKFLHIPVIQQSTERGRCGTRKILRESFAISLDYTSLSRWSISVSPSMVPVTRDEGSTTRRLRTRRVVFRNRSFLLDAGVAFVIYIFSQTASTLVHDETSWVCSPSQLLGQWPGSCSRQRYHPVPMARGDACEASGGG